MHNQQSISQSLIAVETKHNYLVSQAIAILIIVAWFTSLIALLQLDLNRSLVLIIAGVCLRTFIHTGVFIIIHDSIHGVVGQNQKVNSMFGYFTAFLYAMLPYKTLAKNHHQHHRYPATKEDPDYYDLNPHSFWLWYTSFMKDYQQGKQFWILFWGMTAVFWSLVGLKVAIANIFLFWVLPIVLSSLQLFTFGIFLPHRPRKEAYSDRHRAKSNNFSPLFSFLTCYHFGYHWEHHQYPHLPWYKLPLAYRQNAYDSP